MTELETYYYVWKDKAWACFASGLRGKVLDEPPPQSHPLLGREQEKEPAIKGYRTQTKVVDTFRFLRVRKTKLFTYRSASDLEAAIHNFFQRLARWRHALLCFGVASENFYSIIDIVAASKELTGSDTLLIGLYNKYNHSVVFELPEKQNADYDDRVISISEKDNPNTYRKLVSGNQCSSFWMPSKFGKVHYRVQKLFQGSSFLGVALIGEENSTKTRPYVEDDKLQQIFELVLADLRLRRWQDGRKLLEAFFDMRSSLHSDRMTEHLENFRRGNRLVSLNKLCEQIRDKLKTDACTIYWKKDATHLFLAGSTHNQGTLLHNYKIKKPSLTTKCFNSSEPICLFDVSTDPGNTHGFDVEVNSSKKHKSWLAYPNNT